MRALMVEVVPLFERASGAKVGDRIPPDLGAEKRNRGRRGLRHRAVAAAGTRCAGARRQDRGRQRRPTSRARRSGSRCAPARRSPISATVAAFKRTLLAARSIAYSDGPSGAYVAGLLGRLGIADEMKPKTRLTSGPVAELVAAGEAEIGLQQIVAILPVKGADLVGPLPGELQNVIVYAAGLRADAQNIATAQNFIALYGGPEVQRLIRAKGMEPG